MKNKQNSNISITARNAGGLLFAFALSLTASFAQDSEQQPSEQRIETQETEQGEPVKYFLSDFDFGWWDWNLRGNESVFRRYATPPHGFAIRKWNALSLNAGGTDYIRFQFSGAPYQDYNARVDAVGFFGNTLLEAKLSDANFKETTPLPIEVSDRKNFEGYFRQKIGFVGKVTIRYQVDNQNHFSEPPAPDLIQRHHLFDASLFNPLAGGQIGLSFTDWTYRDKTEVLPGIESKQFSINYNRMFSETLGLEGSFSHSEITHPGGADNELTILSLGGNWDMGPSTGLVFSIRHDELDLPEVQNARVRERFSAIAKFIHQWNNWSLNLGVKHIEEERLRADQSFVDVPIWNSADVRLTGKLGNGFRLTARGFFTKLKSQPKFFTDDDRPLYWDARAFGQAKLDKVGENYVAYLIWTHKFLKNEARFVDNETNAFTLGGNWDINENVSAFVEFVREFSRVSGDNSIPNSGTIDQYFPGSRTVSAGINWMAEQGLYLSATYNEFVTDNDNPLMLRDGNVTGKFLNFSFRYVVPTGNEISVSFSPWQYEDAVLNQMNYRASVFTISAHWKL